MQDKGIRMQLLDEILQEFFSNLKKSTLPPSLVTELTSMLQKGQSISKEDIEELIKRYSKDDNKD